MVMRRHSPEIEEDPYGRELGLRAHRRASEQARTLTFGDALAFETADGWPSWRVRAAFWNREEVPEKLRGDGPDPADHPARRRRPDGRLPRAGRGVEGGPPRLARAGSHARLTEEGGGVTPFNLTSPRPQTRVVRRSPWRAS